MSVSRFDKIFHLEVGPHRDSREFVKCHGVDALQFDIHGTFMELVRLIRGSLYT